MKKECVGAMAPGRGRAAACLLAAATLTACAPHLRTRTAASGPGNATIISVGVPDFSLRQPADPVAYVIKVDAEAVGSPEWGYASQVSTRAGKTVLHVLCLLKADALRGTTRPFEPLENGIGNAVVGNGGATSRIRLATELMADGRYELRCEPTGDYRARAWLTELPPNPK